MAIAVTSCALLSGVLMLAEPAPPPSPTVAGAPAAQPTAPLDLSTPGGLFDALTSDGDAPSLTGDQLQSARDTLARAADREPSEARWLTALAILSLRSGDPQKAVELAEKAARLAPDNPRVQFWHGSAVFENMSNLGMFSKMSAAGTGRDAFEKAVKLDPAYIAPRMGLVKFYTEAPGIAGGSMKKARQHAQAVVELGGRGTVLGHIALAQIAAKDEDWAEAERQYRAAAEQPAATPQARSQSLVALALMKLKQRSDPQGALAVADEARAFNAPNDTGPDFVAGQAHQALKHWTDAIEKFRAVLQLNAKAVNTRFFLAECLAENADPAGAATMYQQFIDLAPKDPRADEAASRIKKLRSKLPR